MDNNQKIIIFAYSKEINGMDKQQTLIALHSKLAETKLKLRLVSYLMNNGAHVDEKELDQLLKDMGTLEKMINELEKNK